MKTQLPVTLVIPTYNRTDKTNNLLESLAEADFSCEIILVDDHSTEEIEKLAQSFEEILQVRYVRNEKNMGPAYSRNIGIGLATNPYIAFTDNDCIVTKDWLIRLYEYIRDAPSNIAGVGGRTVALSSDMISQYYEYNKILDPWFHNGKWLYIVSANSIFKKVVLEKVSGFDEEVKKAGGEDVGLCFKIHNEGYDLLYNDDAVILHDFDTGFLKFWKTFFTYGYGSRVQYDKFYHSTGSQKQINFAGLPGDT